jgi:hypothetical protein
MKNLTNKRLLKLARYLGSKHLNDLLIHKTTEYGSSPGNNSIECFDWTFQEFPKLFPEWAYDENHYPYLKKKPELNAFTAAIYFLEIDVDSMFHLFVSGYQMQYEYLGKPLQDDATPGQVSSNIYEYLHAVEETTLKQKPSDNPINHLLTSLKTYRNERNENYLSKVCA